MPGRKVVPAVGRLRRGSPRRTSRRREHSRHRAALGAGPCAARASTPRLWWVRIRSRSTSTRPPSTAIGEINRTRARAFGRFWYNPLAADVRRHPVRCVARRSGFARLALKVMNLGNRREALTVAQAVRIDDGACSLCRVRDCRDEDTATTADQKIAGAGSEPVIFDQRPIIGPNLESPSRSAMMSWLWLRQNEQVHARSGLSSGGFDSRRRT